MNRFTRIGMLAAVGSGLLLAQPARLVKDIDSSTLASSPGIITPVGGQAFFNSFTSATGFELWRTDGTAAGTRLVKDVFPGTVGENRERVGPALSMDHEQNALATW